MPLPKVIPALADLTQDIAGPIPLQILQGWGSGQQDVAAAKTLLAEFEHEGTVVCSDTCGLSRMTQAMDLLEVLSLVSQPKEIIHALGREIGGRGIGVWVADNTEMLYPASVGTGVVVDAMTEAQHRIARNSKVRVGMCVHRGSFYDIGGGLYGADAALVEHLAESCTGPGDVLVTSREGLGAGYVDKRFTVDGEEVSCWLATPGSRMPELRQGETRYPHPFPDDFYRMLPQLANRETAVAAREIIYGRWLREKVVVFLARNREPREEASLAGLLDNLVINALMETVVRETAPAITNVASSAGGLAILTFDSSADALDFARSARAELAKNGIDVRTGIDSGPVLLFENPDGPSGISGEPVNTASKLSEDAGRSGRINITDRAAAALPAQATAERFEVVISGVKLAGLALN